MEKIQRFVVVVVGKYLGDYTGRFTCWAIADRQKANRIVSRKFDNKEDAYREADRMNTEGV